MFPSLDVINSYQVQCFGGQSAVQLPEMVQWLDDRKYTMESLSTVGPHFVFFCDEWFCPSSSSSFLHTSLWGGYRNILIQVQILPVRMARDMMLWAKRPYLFVQSAFLYEGTFYSGVNILRWPLGGRITPRYAAEKHVTEVSLWSFWPLAARWSSDDVMDGPEGDSAARLWLVVVPSSD